MANDMQTVLHICGSKENVKNVENLITTTPEWLEQVRKRNEPLAEEFKIHIYDEDTDTPSKIDFNRLIPTPTDIYQMPVGSKEEEKYGKRTWYEWNLENWGTKWNASEVYVGNSGEELYIEMQTPWSVPDGYLNALVKVCADNDCTLHGEFADEFYGNAAGRFSVVDGELEYTRDDSPELFELVWGFNPEDDE